MFKQPEQRQRMSQTTALHVHHAFYYTSMTSTARIRRETYVMQRFMHGGHEHLTTNFFLAFFSNLDKVLKNSTPGKIAYK